MNSPHQAHPRDKAASRRRYLQKKASLNFYKCAGGTLAVASGGLTLIYAAYDWVTDLPHLVCLTLFMTLFRITTWLWSSSTEEERLLAYVPPVREQIAALPPEDVLLRGSGEPVSVELLRAAHATEREPEKELLRAGRDWRKS